ncbi:hypothetical protein ASD12_18000 [Mesorhizobium sp. Root102]|uniref:hypothetical protein n=1 Tax=Mesorhizobium sp. Root102 TaxID=1736422 RepID=UPI0006F83994|nr:hypothetical protein [Mesorhizobium sp. Root102]KQU77693.1 hypothetical protein ASD12_18000 [Mesorhizobium sp. Root102]
MMLGTIASGLSRQQAGGLATLVAANFVTGTYSVASVAVTAADIVDQPGLITANGLDVPGWTPDAVVEYVGDALAALLTMEWTVVIEYQCLWNTGEDILLVVSNPAGSQFFEMHRGALSTRRMIVTETGDSQYRETIDIDQHNVGLHRIAVTSAAARLSLSVDGDPVITDTSAMDYSGLTRALIGAYFDDETENEFYLRSVTIYDPQEDSLLPTLSA